MLKNAKKIKIMRCTTCKLPLSNMQVRVNLNRLENWGRIEDICENCDDGSFDFEFESRRHQYSCQRCGGSIFNSPHVETAIEIRQAVIGLCQPCKTF